MLHALPSYLSESLIVIIKSTAITEIQIQGCDGCETLFDSKLKTGSEIDADDSRVHLATILTSGGEPIEPRWYYMSLMIMVTVLNLHHFILPLWSRYVFHLDHMLSTLLNSSPNTSTNLIIITDSLRPKKARQILTGLVSKLSIMEPLSLSDDLKHDWQVLVGKSDQREIWINPIKRSDHIHDEWRVPKKKIRKFARLESWVSGRELHL